VPRCVLRDADAGENASNDEGECARVIRSVIKIEKECGGDAGALVRRRADEPVESVGGDVLLKV